MEQDKVTIADIAKRADVSKTTVSRVLNNKPDVDATTRESILAIIRETGFVPHSSAISLAKGKTHLVGLLVPSLTSPYSLRVIQGVAEAIEETEYEVLLYTTSMAEKNQEKFAQRLTKNLTDGLAVLLPRNFEEYGKILLRAQFPVVFIDHRGMGQDYPSITADNRSGALAASRYLASLGHKRIGFITGLMDFGCSKDRLEGYSDALVEAGLAFDPNLVAHGDFSRQSGYASTQELLRGNPRPSAIFCSNDEMALGAMAAATALGLSVPGDISVLGFDDLPNAALSIPALTTVRQPLYEMGRLAAESLLRQIDGEAPPQGEMVLETSLIVRESCRAL